MKRLFIFLVFVVFLISSCTSSTQPPAVQTQEQIKPSLVPATPTPTTAPTETPQPSPTPIPPTETPLPPTDTPTAIPPTNTQPPPTVDIQAVIKSANIILFEDLFFSVSCLKKPLMMVATPIQMSVIVWELSKKNFSQIPSGI